MTGLALACSSAVANAASVSLETNPAPAQVGLGDKVEVSLVTSSDFDPFTAVNINLTYDADVLSYTGTTFSPVFDFLTNDQTGQPDDGSIDAIVGSTLFGQGSGEETLATMSFTAVAFGISNVGVTGTGSGLVTLVGGPPHFQDTVSTSVEVVPLPAPVLLLGSGIAALGLLRRHRARSAEASSRFSS